MREVLIKVYEYEELSEKAQEKAREELGSFDSDDGCDLLENFHYLLAEKGYVNPDGVAFSLTYSQGDGVCFTGVWKGEALLNICERVFSGEIPKNVKRILPFLEVRFMRLPGCGNYAHKHTVEVQIVYDFRDVSYRFSIAEGKLENALEADRVKVCNELEEQGYNYIQEIDGNFPERCKINGWEFYSDGELYSE